MWDSKKTLGLQVLGYYGQGGYPPGGFLTSLLETWGRADWDNKLRLSIGFSELAGVLTMFEVMELEEFRTWIDSLEEEKV